MQPVNTDLVPDYADMSPFLKETDYNSVDGQMWGIPHGWGANLLAVQQGRREAGADGLVDAVFDGASDYAGKVTAYDNPIYIADAALYLMNTQPDLGIKNPYALDEDQLDAAVDVLKEQNESIGEYWTDYTKESQAFKTGSSVIGTTWEYTASISGPKTRDGVPRQWLHRLVRHLDDRGGHRPRELRVRVAELDGDPGDAGRGRPVLR